MDVVEALFFYSRYKPVNILLCEGRQGTAFPIRHKGSVMLAMLGYGPLEESHACIQIHASVFLLANVVLVPAVKCCISRFGIQGSSSRELWHPKQDLYASSLDTIPMWDMCPRVMNPINGEACGVCEISPLSEHTDTVHAVRATNTCTF